MKLAMAKKVINLEFEKFRYDKKNYDGYITMNSLITDVEDLEKKLLASLEEFEKIDKESIEFKSSYQGILEHLVKERDSLIEQVMELKSEIEDLNILLKEKK